MHEIFNNYQIFFTGYAVGCLTTVLINIVYHKMIRNKERSKKERSDQIVQTLDKNLSESFSIKAKPISENEQEKNVSPILKTLIYKIHGGKEPNNEFWKSEFEGNQRNVENIHLDGSKPHFVLPIQKMSLLKIISAVILSSCLFYLLFFIFSKTIPENYLDRFKVQQSQPTVSNVEGNRNKTPPQPASNNSTTLESKSENDEKQIQKNQLVQDFIRNGKYEIKNSPGQNLSSGEYFYIIELHNGENIITQNAIETDGIITVWRPDGSERKFRRNEVKSVKKTQ